MLAGLNNLFGFGFNHHAVLGLHMTGNLKLGHFPKMGCAEALKRFEHYREQVKDYGVDPKKNFAGSTKSLNDLFDNHYILRYAQLKKKS